MSTRGALSVGSPRDFVDQVIAADWVCAQLTTYDLGGLDAFLTERASPALTARAVGADGWPLATMSGYRLVDVQDDQLVAVDLPHVANRSVAQRGRRLGS